jgi:DNA adenine methylase
MRRIKPLANGPKLLRAEPFLRWAGGKRRMVHHLLSYLPPDIAARRYREPFLGAASLFFALGPLNAVLSDANTDLINCFCHVRDNPEAVHRHLVQLAKRSGADHYYKVRAKYNASAPNAVQAARFIFLNKTCFNGIFRVNRHGHFNVPYGLKDEPVLPTLEVLRHASEALRRADLLSCSFELALADAQQGDFYYIDPPYPPLNGTSNFTRYTRERFAVERQRALANHVRKVSRRGAKIMVTNADLPLIRELYADFAVIPLAVTRFITCKAKKHSVGELVITNY